ncbi:MAG: competence/damage-inducible protein A [Clostridia bacterium]|nr:competence/damage-inducible protein A [Clostridia bacterium]
MVVEIISVGTELLLGTIVNTNAAYLAEQCAFLGLFCYHQSTVGDNAERLEMAIRTAKDRSDVIILTGGLGPTDDDLTKEITVQVFGRELYMHEESKSRIEQFFRKKNIEIPDNNWKQAMIPKDAIVVNNDNGTAPGVIIEDGEKTIILLPGPPNELVPMFEDKIYPYLLKKTPDTIYSQTIKVCGLGESAVAEMLEDLMDSTDPTVAPYAKTGEVHLRVTAVGADEKEAKKKTKPMVKELKSRLGSYIYTTDSNIRLEDAVIDLLDKNHLSVSTVESCTGGMLASRLISVPGASAVYKEGMITYSNKAKRNRAAVKKSSLIKYGAVSEQVAKEMAKGGAYMTKTDVCVATTGIAGPGGGSDEKPVGLVYIACSVCGKITVKEFHFTGNRQKVRESATSAALTLMRLSILEYYSEITFGKNK